MDITDEMYTVADSINEASNVWKEPSSGDQQSFQDQIRSRLQHLELELTSVLCLLRTNTDSALSNKVYILPFCLIYILFYTISASDFVVKVEFAAQTVIDLSGSS